LAEFFLSGQNLRHLEIGIFLRDGFNRRIGSIDTDFIHDFKGPHDPAQSDFGAAVGVLNRGNSFIDQRSRNS